MPFILYKPNVSSAILESYCVIAIPSRVMFSDKLFRFVPVLAYNLFVNEVSLPLHTKLSDEDVEYVITNFVEIVKSL